MAEAPSEKKDQTPTTAPAPEAALIRPTVYVPSRPPFSGPDQYHTFYSKDPKVAAGQKFNILRSVPGSSVRISDEEEPAFEEEKLVFRVPESSWKRRKQDKTTGNEESDDNATRATGRNLIDNSLHQFTKKLVNLVKKSQDGTLELNQFAEKLDVKKRRLFDLTNMLEGAGLVEKKVTNKICWKGFKMGRAGVNFPQLWKEMEKLEKYERSLDEKISEMKENMKELTEHNKEFLFAAQNDKLSLRLKDKTLIAISAPEVTTLEVPDSNKDGDEAESLYKFILRSDAGPIKFYLVSRIEVITENANDNDKETAIPLNNGPDNNTEYWLASHSGFNILDLWDTSCEGDQYYEEEKPLD
ncbi:hypothetical protein LUZ60_007459 [Juncus effusus]|nr:hypothetical protein LUZ60_007459 [Juncus effusus]